MNKKPLNRIKVVLVENNKSNKWLALKLGKNEATISRWCTNDVQPTLTAIVKIAEILEVTPSELIKL
jgi:transcriptional regulator with XRE-family HTH domain